MRLDLGDWLGRWAPYFPSGTDRKAVIARTAALWLVLIALSLSGALAPLNGWLFDGLVRAWPLRDLEPTVALIHYGGASAASTDDVDLEGLARRLRSAGAREVLVVSSPGSAPPAAASTLALDAGAGCRPPAIQGVVRSLPLRDAEGAPCLIARLAAGLGLEAAGDRVSPDFSVRTATALPRLSVGANTGMSLVEQVAAGRIALVYPELAPPVYVTPLYAADGLLEPSLLHALALDSIVRDESIRWAPRGADVVFAMLVSLALHFGLLHVRYRPTLIITLLSAIPVVLASALLLRMGDIYLPATAALIAIAAFWLRTVLKRVRTLGDTLVELDHRLTGLVQQPLNRAFEQPAELTWEHANHFVAQFFELQRSLMLQLPPNAAHLKPVSAIGCTFDDIAELRRDYRRAPYSTALARGKPTAPERPFLQSAEGLIDFVTPLVAADRLVGFWAFSVQAQSDAELAALVPEAARYAEELAKIVLRSEDATPADDEPSRRSPSLVRMRSRLIDGAMRAREQIAAYRDVFSAVAHPIAVTDLLGRIQFANPPFEQLAAGVSQPLLAMSVHNMLEQLCGLTPAAAKDVLRRVVLQPGMGETRFAVRNLDVSVDYTLSVHPIRRQIQGAIATHGSPFELLGLIVEISPAAPENGTAPRSSQAARQYTSRTWALLDGMLRDIERLPIAAGERAALIERIARGLDDAQRTMRGLEATSKSDEAHVVEVDLRQLLHRVRDALMHHASEKKVEIVIHEGGPRTGWGRPDELRAVLTDTLDLLLDDAGPNTRITIAVTRARDGAPLIELSNDGYGLPQWHVAEAMRAGTGMALADGGASPLERVAHTAGQLDPAVGFEIDSELGKGYVARLIVRCGHPQVL